MKGDTQLQRSAPGENRSSAGKARAASAMSISTTTRKAPRQLDALALRRQLAD
jgi:hypothetical protein